MNLEQTVQLELIASAARSELMVKVLEVLEREAAKMRDCGDRETADYTEMLAAKMRALEKT